MACIFLWTYDLFLFQLAEMDQERVIFSTVSLSRNVFFHFINSNACPIDFGKLKSCLDI